MSTAFAPVAPQARFSPRYEKPPTPLRNDDEECFIWPRVCCAHCLAFAAIAVFHLSNGTPCMHRYLLCLSKTAAKFESDGRGPLGFAGVGLGVGWGVTLGVG